MSAITLNQQVPDFSFHTADGSVQSLSSYRGKYLVLYFYPKDNTPGCTREAQDFRDLHADFQASDAVILGVSRDSHKSHDGFRCKYDLPFDLISDSDESLCNLFDVIRMKNMYGKQVRGIERSTFVIDPEGRLVAEWRKVTVEGHASKVLQQIREYTA